jgi:hypothetical protein
LLNRTSPRLACALCPARCDLYASFSEPFSHCFYRQTKPGSQIAWNQLGVFAGNFQHALYRGLRACCA